MNALKTLFIDKEQKLFLKYLSVMIEDGSLTKEQIFSIRKKTYIIKKNKKWQKKMDMLIYLILEGETLETSLFKVKIINEIDLEYLSLAKDTKSGIERIINNKDKASDYYLLFFRFFIIPLLALFSGFFVIYASQNINEKIIEPFKTIKMITPATPPEYIYNNTHLYITLAWIFIIFINIGLYSLLKKHNTRIFLKLYKIENYSLFLKILNDFTDNAKLGLNDLNSVKLLKNGTDDIILKNVYEQFYTFLSQGTYTSYSRILRKIGFEESTIGIIEIAENSPENFIKLLSQASNNLQLEYDNSLLFAKNFSKGFSKILLFLFGGLAFAIEAYYISIDFPQSLM